MYEKALREVSEVLEHVDPELTKKIPSSFMNLIIENADWSYDFEYDETKSYEEQNLSEEARTIMAMIYVQSFTTDESEKEKLVSQMRENDIRDEQEKREKYNIDNLFNRDTKKIDYNNFENVQTLELGLIEVAEEKWYKKIFNKIKKIFKL